MTSWISLFSLLLSLFRDLLQFRKAQTSEVESVSRETMARKARGYDLLVKVLKAKRKARNDHLADTASHVDRVVVSDNAVSKTERSGPGPTKF